jgi:plastocyanin
MTSIRAALAAILVGIALAGCGTGPAGPVPSPPADGAAVTADALAFDRERLEVPAGRTFRLLFENREAAPHNVSILEDGTAVFTGEVFGGPSWRMYEVPPLDAGTYRFRCDLHPEMTGEVIAADADR